MAATVLIYEHNGVGETKTDKTGGVIRCKAADDANVDSNGNLSQPTGGAVARSYEKWIRLAIGGVGPGSSISNLQLYATGSTGAGSTVYVRTVNPTVYATPAIPGSDAAGTDVTTFTTGARKSLGAGPYSTINTDIGDFAVLWMTITSAIAAPQNPTPSLSLFLSYDEV
jgi:hypothetical protein